MNFYDPVKSLDRIVNAAVLRIECVESDELYSTIVREAIVAGVEEERESNKASVKNAMTAGRKIGAEEERAACLEIAREVEEARRLLNQPEGEHAAQLIGYNILARSDPG